MWEADDGTLNVPVDPFRHIHLHLNITHRPATQVVSFPYFQHAFSGTSQLKKAFSITVVYPHVYLQGFLTLPTMLFLRSLRALARATGRLASSPWSAFLGQSAGVFQITKRCVS